MPVMAAMHNAAAAAADWPTGLGGKANFSLAVLCSLACLEGDFFAWVLIEVKATPMGNPNSHADSIGN